MEHIARRLRRKSTLRGNDFDYTIKHEHGKVSPETPPILISQAELSPKIQEININSANFINNSTRRPNRYNTVEASNPTPHPQKKYSFNIPISSKDRFDLPIDFSNSLMNTPKSALSPKISDSLSSFSSKIDKVLTPKFDSCHRFFEENKIAELSSSQEISMPDLKSMKKNKHSRTNSISFELESNVSSLICNQNERLSIHPFLKVVSTTDAKSDPTLETDKQGEFNSIQSECFRLKLKPSQTEVVYMNFDDALRRFNSMIDSYTEASLWINGVSDYLCGCFIKKEELSEEFQNLCEKIIVFSYSGFDSGNIFHSSLLASVFNSLQSIQEGKSNWIDVGFSNNNPYDKDLNHNVAPVGLLFIMFLFDYVRSTLKSMLSYCAKMHLAFIPLAFDVAEIAVLTLRKRKLNSLMNQSDKCLEILFFFFAGCLAEWFSLHKELNGRVREVGHRLETQAFRDPAGFINLAKTLMSLAGASD